MVWTTQENFRERTILSINGDKEDVPPGADFVEIVKSAARRQGLNKFKVYLNGEEVDKNEAPNVVEEGDEIEVRAYDVAA